jgi:hypothetical protein
MYCWKVKVQRVELAARVKVITLGCRFITQAKLELETA